MTDSEKESVRPIVVHTDPETLEVLRGPESLQRVRPRPRPAQPNSAPAGSPQLRTALERAEFTRSLTADSEDFERFENGALALHVPKNTPLADESVLFVTVEIVSAADPAPEPDV